MLGVSVFAYLSASNSLLLKSVDQLGSVAAKQVDRVNAIVQGQQENTTVVANRYDLRLQLAQYMSNPSAANKMQLNAIMQDAKATYPTMQYLRLFDASGNLIASSIAEQSSSDFIAKLIMPGTGDVNNVRVVKDPQDGLIKIEISTRINASALLSAVFRTDDLTAVMQDYTGLDQTGETMLTGGGNISFFPLRFNTEAALKTDLANFPALPTTSGSYGSVTDYRNQQTLYVTDPVGVSDWRIITKVDRDEALASTAALKSTMMGIIAFAAVFISIMAYFDMRALTRPILKMDKIARQIGNGDFSASVNSKRKDEMGTLGRSIDAMKNNLSSLIRGIESQRERLEIVLNTTTEGIFAIDDDGIVLIANHAAEILVGGTVKDLVGKHIEEIFSWEHGMQPFTVNYRQTEAKTYENLRYTDMDGSVHYVKLIVAPVHGSGEVQAGRTRAIVTIHDETSSRELENMKTDFVSMAAHELRTPLTAVRGYLEMASGDRPGADNAVFVDKALKNVNELSGLINNLLDVTRIERGTLVLNMEKVDFAACISQAVENSSFAAKDRSITLSYVGPKNDKWVVGDEIALREIVNNLLSNAIKYTQPNGKVEASLVELEGKLSLHVKDNGVGISKDAQKYLFNKFYRVHGGLDSGSKGTGLGLYIAKSIAERHRGTITVESDIGKGSLFTLSLPEFDQARLDEMQTNNQNTGKEIRRKRGWVTKNITR